MIRFVGCILALLYLFTGTGAARYVHLRDDGGPRVAQAVDVSYRGAVVSDEHDESRCAICTAIAASHFAHQSKDVDHVGERLVARQLAIDGRRDSAAVPERRPCRDPPIV